MKRFIARMMLPVVRWFYNNTLLQVHEGIKICEMANSSATEKVQNLDRIIRAIDLIKTNDPRRFRRIQQRLQYVVNMVCTGRGQYGHWPKACTVDLTQFEFEANEDYYLVLLACTLIHEATHGEIEAHNITYSRRNSLRIERVCDQEERRFLARIGNEASNDKFDGAWWEDRWMSSAWQDAAKLIKRIR